MRCHHSNPCTGFAWNNVTSTSVWDYVPLVGSGYITENVYGSVDADDRMPNEELENRLTSPLPGFNRQPVVRAENLAYYFALLFERIEQWAIDWIEAEVSNQDLEAYEI